MLEALRPVISHAMTIAIVAYCIYRYRKEQKAKSNIWQNIGYQNFDSWLQTTLPWPSNNLSYSDSVLNDRIVGRNEGFPWENKALPFNNPFL